MLDSLLGIIFISILVYILFMLFSQGKEKYKLNYKKIIIYMYLIPLIFLLEWFLNHPSMRYGGYVLFAIPIFIFTAQCLEKLLVKPKNVKKISIFFICLTLILFNGRNALRIEKEIKLYDYNLIKNPFFFVKEVNSIKIFESDDYTIYSTKDGEMCWASKTPCSNAKNLKSKKYLGFNMIYRND